MAGNTIVLITGANSGIGYAASKIISSASPNYHVIVAGRSLQASIAAAAKKVEQEFGRVDVLINNAGVAHSSEASYKAQINAITETNVIGPLLVCEQFMPLVLKSKKPYSIFVSSSLASLGLATTPGSHYDSEMWQVYRMTKSALNMIAGVKVFPMCPGLVRSNLRGAKEENVSAGGRAGSADVSGETILSIIEGKRDIDVGKFVHKDGVHEWCSRMVNSRVPIYLPEIV
ncbi:short chain dehydrogenase [Paraphaeosphaeria minitans]|uniref:Short chain dehydrogenase n=1 Tax=Paraphaeosphaeria minitans TaxID=565426 RepID=A0A9P6GPW8_9PLEO|nr:short chain dehydrogenase [Paraphaeosphaeria minitans]